jgi:hypothetical protein
MTRSNTVHLAKVCARFSEAALRRGGPQSACRRILVVRGGRAEALRRLKSAPQLKVNSIVTRSNAAHLSRIMGIAPS